MFRVPDSAGCVALVRCPMKRLLLVLLLLAGSLTAAYGYSETRRERNYRRLIDQGELALAAGNTSAAIEAFSGAVVLKPDSMLGYLRRGEAYRRRRDLDDALRDLLEASELDPTAPRPLELLGDVNASLLRYDRAAARYSAYLAIDDQSPQVLYKLGLVALSRRAAHRGRSGAAQGPRAQPAFRGGALPAGPLPPRRPAQRRGADRAGERPSNWRPTLLPAREELADLYGRMGRTDERLTQLEALAALDPGPRAQRRARPGLRPRRA